MVPVWAEAIFERKRRDIKDDVNREGIRNGVIRCKDMTISAVDRAVARYSWELEGRRTGGVWTGRVLELVEKGEELVRDTP
jgi:hypothetical protein